MLEQDAIQEAMSQFLIPVISEIQANQQNNSPIPVMPPTSIPNPAQYGQGRLAAGYENNPNIPQGYHPMRDPFQPPPDMMAQYNQQQGNPQPGLFGGPRQLGQGMAPQSEIDQMHRESSLFNRAPNLINGIPEGATSDPRSPLGFTFGPDQEANRQKYHNNETDLAGRLAAQQYIEQAQERDLRDRLKVIEAVSKLPADQGAAILKAIGLNVPPGRSKAQEHTDEALILARQKHNLEEPGKAETRAATLLDKTSLAKSRDLTAMYQQQLLSLQQDAQKTKNSEAMRKLQVAIIAAKQPGSNVDPHILIQMATEYERLRQSVEGNTVTPNTNSNQGGDPITNSRPRTKVTRMQ